MEIGKMIQLMDMESMLVLILNNNIKEDGNKGPSMEKEFKNLKMGQFIRVIMLMELKKDKGNQSIRMEQVMKDNLKIM